jgi:sec-independent protein translocase protein TatB
MFGFSLAELIVVLLVILFFIKPKDLPEIAHFLGKIFYRLKSYYKQLKSSFKELENEFGIQDLKNELERGIAEEKSKLEDDFTIIVDMEGNEHRVPNLHEVRSDLDEEKLKEEIESLNQQNKQNPKIKN